MTHTPHLGLPLLAAAQAQKHVTHNEALAALDALVQLSVKERGRTLAPAAPEEGERYLVGPGASGDFANHDGEIALFDLGIWRFFQPRRGWRAYVEAEDRIVAYDGSAWRDLGHFSRDLDRVERLGLGTAPDDLNRLSAKLNAALFVALTEAEGGSGDLRFVLNKGDEAKVLSQLYQSGFSGRAEMGLIGSEDFRIRVSPDGAQWRDAILVDRQTGIVSFPSGLAWSPAPNLLVNGAFAVNQRGFAGGTLAAGAYGFDRWKAGPGGCVLNRAADGTVTLTDTLEQVVDVAQAASLTGSDTFAGARLTLSVEDPSVPLLATIGRHSATIPAGSGRRSATVTLDADETGHIPVRLQTAGEGTFRRAKLEIGPGATPFAGETLEAELLRCRRYYQRIATTGGVPAMLGALAQRVGTNAIDLPLTLPVPMRAAPAVSTSLFAWVGNSPSGNQAGFYDPAGATWVTQSGGLSVTTAAPSGPAAVILRFRAALTFSGAPGIVGHLYLGTAAHIALQAEL